jgi:uncharacterized protein (TIGR02996 family)
VEDDMPRKEPFLEAVLEAPDDDTPRLIYADWLEERGDPRGEFIRLQCALARMPRDDPHFVEGHRRARLLGLEHGKAWAEPLKGLINGWRFHRGFIEEVTLAAETFVKRGGDLFALAPVRYVRLTSSGKIVRKVAGSPHLARLTALDLINNRIGDNGVKTLLGSPHLGALKLLHVGFNSLTDFGARTLALQPRLPQLVTLNLYGNEIGPRGTGALATSLRWPALTTLVLGSNQVGDEGAEHLAAVARARLRTLVLSFNGITDAGARRLLSSPHLAGLETLHLYGNPLGPKVSRALRARFGEHAAG